MISVIDIIIISVLFLLKPCSISLSQSLYQSIYIHHSYNQKEFDVWVWCLVLVVSHFHCTQTLFSLLPDLTQKHSQHSARTTQYTHNTVHEPRSVGDCPYACTLQLHFFKDCLFKFKIQPAQRSV